MGSRTAGRRIGVAIGAAILLSALFAVTAYGQTSGKQIAGQVVNGSDGGAVPANVMVMLEALSQGNAVGSVTILADDQGYFSFTSAPGGGDSYRVSVIYGEVPYSVEFGPVDDASNLFLHVYETTNSLDDISVATSSLLVLGADPKTRRVSFMELSSVVNSSDLTFVPNQNSGAMQFLRFPLPPKAADLQIQAELPGGQAIQVDQGFGMTTPVPPGQYSVAFSYTAPYSGNTYQMSRSFALNVSQFRVLVPEKLGSVTADSGLHLNGEAAIGSDAYWVLEGDNVGTSTSLSFAIHGLPQPTLWNGVQSVFGGNVALIVAPAVVIAGLGVLLFFGLRMKAARSPKLAPVMVMDRETLLKAVASLDDEYERGEVGEEAYQRQRSALMAQLLQVTR